MRKLALFGGGLMMFLAGACGAEDAATGTEGPDDIATTSEAVVGTCSFATFGMPCDPDGPLGAKLECQGICIVSGSPAAATCVSVTGPTTTNGLACGTVGGIGDGVCANKCLNGACVVSPAAKGVGCRPSGADDACSGACDGAGKCVAVTAPCKFGLNNCTFDSCNQRDVSQCVTSNVLTGTACEDGNACTINDRCGSGNCVPGPDAKCDDKDVCTNDSCNASNGACTHTYNTAPCSDGSACTTGDQCSGGSCKPGGATNCDDNNLCTADSCDKLTGCANTPINCNDNDACTTDSCNTTDGKCVNTAKNCDDGKACTTDTCNSTGAGCVNTAKDCNDNDPCTTDSCAEPSGACSNTPIPNCGTGGTGGTGGSAGSGGATGGTGGATGGAAGSGGATGGTGGASGGAAGSGGASGGAAGSGGASGGAAGSGGGAGAGGSAGASGSSGASGSGGTAGVGGGAAGSGGSTGGSAGSGATGGSSTGGTGNADAGVDAGKGGGGSSDDDSGCSCRVPAQAPSGPHAWMLAALAALGVTRRRRRG